MVEAASGTTHSIVEDILLSLGVDEKSRTGWLEFSKAVDSAGHSVLNIIQNHEALSKTMSIYHDSAVTTFRNTGQLVSSLAGRVERVTKEFNTWTAVVESGGATLDVLNFKWAEMSNSFSRWIQLAKTAGPSIAVLYTGYKVLTTVISLTMDAWYKMGQAMADQVITYQNMSESSARLTGVSDNLIHRLDKLAEIRVFRDAGRDLQGVGQAMTATTRAMNAAGTGFQYLITRGTQWIMTSGVMQGSVEGLTDRFNAFVISVNSLASRSSEEVFSTRSFDSVSEAIAHVTQNMRQWSEETSIAEGDLTQMLERTSRQIGDVAATASLLTAALDHSYQRHHINAREMIGLMGNLATGTGVTTEQLRAFGAEIDTSSANFADAGNNVRFVIDQLLSHRSQDERDSIFTQIANNAVSAYGMMETSLQRFRALEMDLNEGRAREYERIMGLQTSSWEEEAKRIQVAQQYLGQYLEQQKSQVSLLESQLHLQEAFAGVSVADQFAPQMAVLGALRDKFLEETANGMNHSARETARAMNSAAASLFSEVKDKAVTAFRTIGQMAVPLTQLELSLVSQEEVQMAGEVADRLNRGYAEALEMTTRIIDVHEQQFRRQHQDDATRLSTAVEITREFAAAREMMTQAIENHQKATLSARMSVTDLYALEGTLLQENAQARIEAFQAEMQMARELAATRKGDQMQVLEDLNRQKAALTSMTSELDRMAAVGQATSRLAFQLPDERARESAFERHLPRLIRSIMETGRLSPAEEMQRRQMGQEAQQLMNMQARMSEARIRQTEINPRLQPLIDQFRERGGRPDHWAGFIESVRKEFGESNTNFQRALQAINDSGLAEIAEREALAQMIGASSPQETQRRLADEFNKVAEAVGEIAQGNKANLEEFDRKYSALFAEAHSVITAQSRTVLDLTDLLTSLTSLFNNDFPKVVDRMEKILITDFDATLQQFWQNYRGASEVAFKSRETSDLRTLDTAQVDEDVESRIQEEVHKLFMDFADKAAEAHKEGEAKLQETYGQMREAFENPDTLISTIAARVGESATPEIAAVVGRALRDQADIYKPENTIAIVDDLIQKMGARVRQGDLGDAAALQDVITQLNLLKGAISKGDSAEARTSMRRADEAIEVLTQEPQSRTIFDFGPDVPKIPDQFGETLRTAFAIEISKAVADNIFKFVRQDDDKPIGREMDPRVVEEFNRKLREEAEITRGTLHKLNESFLLLSEATERARGGMAAGSTEDSSEDKLLSKLDEEIRIGEQVKEGLEKMAGFLQDLVAGSKSREVDKQVNVNIPPGFGKASLQSLIEEMQRRLDSLV